MMEHLTEEALRAAYSRYDAGEKVAAVGESYGVSETYLREMWKRHAMWTGMRTTKCGRQKKMSDDAVVAAWARYESGEFTAAESAKNLGVRADSLRERWKKMGYTLRQNKGTERRRIMLEQGYKKVSGTHPCITLNGRCLICTDQS